MVKYILHYLISSISKKRFLGKDYIFFNEFVSQTIFLYSICSTLGYTYKDKLHILLEIMTDDKDNINEAIIGLDKMAQIRYKEMRSTTLNFTELIFETELPRLMEGFYKSKIIEYKNVSDFDKVYNTKIPVETAIYSLQPTAYQAIGFGYKYPNITKEFLTFSVSKDFRDLANKSGLNTTHQQDLVIPIHIQQENVKAVIKPYVEFTRPDLISKLDLE